MQKREIIIDVLDSGEVKVETRGYSGKSCTQESEWIKKIIGEEQARELKACYFSEGKQVIKKHIPLCG